MKVERLKKKQYLITCENDEEEKKLEGLLKGADPKILGMKNKKTYRIDIQDIFYIESVDKKTFIYTEQDVFETSKRLYEFENELHLPFLRVSKSTILNINKISSLQADLGGRLMCNLDNHERISISRQYAQKFKAVLRGEEDAG